jgi:hypothetical protein
MMNVALLDPVPLLIHPSTPSSAVRSLDVQLSMAAPDLLTLRYNLQAQMSRIRVGSELVSGRADGLWKHTCFEAFIQPGGSDGYYELNFSPTRQWAVYHFDAYREGMKPVELSRSPEIVVRKAAHLLELEASFALPVGAAAGAVPRSRMALTAVVEEENGSLCYWSVRHPRGKPDFHHTDGFALEL